MDEEDLYQNPIFSSMVTHLPDFERRACEENWLVLIPQLLSLEQLDLDAIDLSFLQKHILKPSPYLKDEFISEDGARRIVLSNGKLFHCGAGDDQEGVAVLFDEVFYSDLGSYTAYCIEKPMLQLKKRRVSSRKYLDGLMRHGSVDVGSVEMVKRRHLEAVAEADSRREPPAFVGA